MTTQRNHHPQFVRVIGSVTQPATARTPLRKYTNVITLNATGTDLLTFSCPSAQDLISWTTAFRLSCWEKSRLEEIYTAHLIRITMNDGGNVSSTLADGRLEGWVRVKIPGQTDWKRFWMCVSAGMTTNTTRSSTDVAPTGSNSLHPSTPKKNRIISGLFSRDKLNDLPKQANISLYNAPRGKDRKKPFLTFEAVTQAFAVYPERPKLISSSTVIKLEGTYGHGGTYVHMSYRRKKSINHVVHVDDAAETRARLRHREGWLMLMPDLEGARGVNGEMLRWVIGKHVSFSSRSGFINCHE